MNTRKTLSLILSLVMVITALPLTAVSSFAATTYVSGDYEYTLSDSNATITKYTGDAVGVSVTTPKTLDGYTVTEIGSHAFETSDIGTVKVSEGVKKIGQCAFKDCVYLTTVSLPSTLESIGKYERYSNDYGAFKNCQVLNSVTIADGNTDLTIANATFLNCSGLKKITIPGRCISIEGSSFVGCSSLESFTLNKNASSKAQALGAKIFSGCSKLKSVSLPDTLTEIPEYAFEGTVITAFNVQKGIEKIGKGAFRNCSYLKSVSLPSTLETLGESERYNNDIGAFYNCTKLSNVTFAETNDDLTIAKGTFRNCSAIKEITVPSKCVSVGESCFVGCSALESFAVNNITPSSAISIGAYIFSGCSNLKNVVLPDIISKIPEYAFEETQITSFDVNEGVEEIGAGAFKNCTKLKSITLPSTLTVIKYQNYTISGVFYNCQELSTVTIKDGINYLTIENGTFEKCSSLTSITLPGRCTSIGNSCFADCENLKSFTLNKNEFLKEQSIGSKIFSGCSKLKSVSLPDTITKIPSYAFEGTAITSFEGKEGLETIDGGAFKNCANLIYVTLPDTLTTINDDWYYDSGAFYNCQNLNTVIIEEGDYDLKIDDRTFCNCTDLQTVHLPIRTASVSKNAFENCSSSLCLCSIAADCFAATYANENSLKFKVCTSHDLPNIPDFDDPSVNPDDPSVNPDDPSVNPDDPSVNPDDPSINPDDPSVNPDDPSVNPDDPSINPNPGNTDIIPGDVNGDGKVTVVDAKWILQSVANSRVLTDEQRTAADVNGDGKVTVVDAKWILQAVAGMRVL